MSVDNIYNKCYTLTHFATILIQATAFSRKRVDIHTKCHQSKRWKGNEEDPCNRNYKFIGPQQTRPANFNESLKSPSFKRELPTFLLNEWKEEAYAHIIHERHDQHLAPENGLDLVNKQ